MLENVHTHRVKGGAVPCVHNLFQEGEVLRSVVLQNKVHRFQLNQSAEELTCVVSKRENLKGKARKD